MDYEPRNILPNMDDHVFNDVDDDDVADDEEGDVNATRTDELARPYLLDLTMARWCELAGVNVREVRQHVNDCIMRKRDNMKYITMQVTEMRTSTWSISM